MTLFSSAFFITVNFASGGGQPHYRPNPMKPHMVVHFMYQGLIYQVPSSQMRISRIKWTIVLAHLRALTEHTELLLPSIIRGLNWNANSLRHFPSLYLSLSYSCRKQISPSSCINHLPFPNYTLYSCFFSKSGVRASPWPLRTGWPPYTHCHHLGDVIFKYHFPISFRLYPKN